jgi:hypothetical protein
MKRDLAIWALDMALDHCSRTNGEKWSLLCDSRPKAAFTIRVVIRWSSVIGSLTQVRFDRLMIGAAWLYGVV